jgi:hypothetical protein
MITRLISRVPTAFLFSMEVLAFLFSMEGLAFLFSMEVLAFLFSMQVLAFLFSMEVFPLPAHLHQPLHMLNIVFPNSCSNLKVGKVDAYPCVSTQQQYYEILAIEVILCDTPSPCFLAIIQKQTYKPVPMVPPTSISQLPFQTHDQYCYCNISVLINLKPERVYVASHTECSIALYITH